MKKGPLAEKAVVDFLREQLDNPNIERRVMGGANDRGDVAGIPGLVVEVKNQQAMALAEWVDEAKREAWQVCPEGIRDCPDCEGSSPNTSVVWHKRRGRGSPGDWYVTMDGWTFLEFLKEWAR